MVTLSLPVVKIYRRALAGAAAVRRARSARLLAAQLAGAVSVLAGIAMWSVPAALIVGGLGAIIAVEMQPARQPK